MAIIGATAIGGNRLALVVDHDPETERTNAPAGSLVIYQGAWYRKTSSGDTVGATRETSAIGASGFSGGGSGFSGLGRQGFSGFSYSGYSGVATPTGSAGPGLGTYPGLTLSPGSVGTAQLVDQCVRARNYVASSIDASKIQDDSLSANYFQAGSIDSDNTFPLVTDYPIAEGAITTSKIANDSVPSSLMNIPISPTLLADGAIDAAHVAFFFGDALVDAALTSVNLLNQCVNPWNIKTKSLGTNKLSAGCVGSDSTQPSTLSTDKIQDGAILSRSLLQDPKPITEKVIADDSVSTQKIKDEELDTRVFATSAFTKDQIEVNSIETRHIKNLAVATAKIKDGAINTAKLKDVSLENKNFGLHSIQTANIQDEAVNYTKSESVDTFTGDLYVYGNGPDNYVFHFQNGFVTSIDTVSS